MAEAKAPYSYASSPFLLVFTVQRDSRVLQSAPAPHPFPQTDGPNRERGYLAELHRPRTAGEDSKGFLYHSCGSRLVAGNWPASLTIGMLVSLCSPLTLNMVSAPEFYEGGVGGCRNCWVIGLQYVVKLVTLVSREDWQLRDGRAASSVD